jgi:hypothetical protein
MNTYDVGQSEEKVVSVLCNDDSIIGRLKRKQQRATSELEVVNQAIAALEKNPELAKTLELIQKAGR